MSTLEAQLLKSINTASANNNLFEPKIAISPSGDVYVTGRFNGTLDIGGGLAPITTISTNGSAFLAKYTSTLTPTLLQYIGGTDMNDFSFGTSVAVSPSGDVYVTGDFGGTLSIGGGVTPISTISTSESSFVAKYTSTLTPTLLKYIGGTATTDFSNGIFLAVSQSGDVYVTGIFRGTLSIGGGVTPVTTISSTYSGFLAKYTGTLTPTILQYIGGTVAADEELGSSVAISPSGDVYVTGNFKGTLSIGGGVPPITNGNSTSISAFVAKYTSTLTPTHLNYIGSTATTDEANGYSLAVSSSGDVYVTGDFGGTLSIGGGVTPITTISTFGSAFVAKYTSTLTPTLLKYIGGTANTDSSVGYYVAVSSGGDVYVTGYFIGTISIGGGVTPITNIGGAFVARYTNTLTPTLLKYIGGTSANDGASGKSVTVSSSGDVYISGRFNGTISIGGGVPSITFNGIGTYENGFLAKYLTILPTTTIPPTTSTTIPPTTSTTTHNEPICLVSGTPILTDQGIVAIENIDTTIHTISNQHIVAVTKAITPEKNLVCFEPHSVAINCPTKRTVMTSGHEVLYKGKLVQAKHFVGTINGVHTVPYDGKVVYNVLLQQHGVMSVNNMIVETLNPENKVAKRILNAF
jgi:hypothetical protein